LGRKIKIMIEKHMKYPFTILAIPAFVGCSAIPNSDTQGLSSAVTDNRVMQEQALRVRFRTETILRRVELLTEQSYKLYVMREQLDNEDCADFRDANMTGQVNDLKWAFNFSLNREVEIGGETLEGAKQRALYFEEVYGLAIGNYRAILELCSYARPQ
jgi:hypothetical protein